MGTLIFDCIYHSGDPLIVISRTVLYASLSLLHMISSSVGPITNSFGGIFWLFSNLTQTQKIISSFDTKGSGQRRRVGTYHQHSYA